VDCAPRLRDAKALGAVIGRHARHLRELRLLRVGFAPLSRAIASCEHLRSLALRVPGAGGGRQLGALAAVLGPCGAEIELQQLELHGQALGAGDGKDRAGLLALCATQGGSLRRLALHGGYRLSAADTHAVLRSVCDAEAPSDDGEGPCGAEGAGAEGGAGGAPVARLQTLELSGLRALSDEALVTAVCGGRAAAAAAAEEGPGATGEGAGGPRELRLRTLRCRSCGGLTDAMPRLLCRAGSGRFAAMLRELDLGMCAQLGDEALRHLAAGGAAVAALRALRLEGCPRLTGAGLQHLAGAPFELEVLDLRGCTGICDAAVEVIDGALPSLRSLVLSGCNVGDLGIQLLGRGCTGLANLDLGDCGADRITKIGVWHLALATPLRLSLQRLVLPSLYGCLSGIQLLRRLRDTPDDETDDDEWSDDDKL